MSGTMQSLMVRAGCAFTYEIAAPSAAVFLIRPNGSGATMAIEGESWTSDPAVSFHDYRDLYGNMCRRMTLPQGNFAMRYEVDVAISPQPAPADPNARRHAIEELPDDVLLYTLASRFCLSDEVTDEAYRLFGSIPLGWECVEAICYWVHHHVRFHYSETRPFKTAIDTLREATGVCRDFAHLAITFCRAMSIPARYAFGYLPDIDVPPPTSPMDFCAWIEVYLGGQWWTFDPRNNRRRIGNIVIGRGRDAADVPMVTTYGAARFDTMTVWADVVE